MLFARQSPSQNFLKFSMPDFAKTVKIRFLPNDVSIVATVGEGLLQVADRAGVMIPTGCLMGSCHACEVEIEDGEAICACISAVPPGLDEMTINLFVDPTW
jgi:ferredoxin